ncbi:MAG: hypothetical protein EXR64_03470 [Dehalococcoidia bacterium]|nr:hypothetical protein [Dehalococcoidia bacterium]
MNLIGGPQSARLAFGAAAAGLAWGYLRHRQHPRRTLLALVQAMQWFVAMGGMAALLDALRGDLEGSDELTERVTHTTQTIREGQTVHEAPR